MYKKNKKKYSIYPNIYDRHLRKQFFEFRFHNNPLHYIPSGSFHEEPMYVRPISSSSARNESKNYIWIKCWLKKFTIFTIHYISVKMNKNINLCNSDKTKNLFFYF